MLLSINFGNGQVIAHPSHGAASDATTPPTVQPASEHSDHDEMQHHQSIEIPTEQPVPSLKLRVYPDAVRGVNLEVRLTNFAFAPERVNQKSLTTEGHAHLYVDGRKVTRLYGTWYYLSDLPPGKHHLTVTLNTNGHEALTHDGAPIQATQTIEIPVPSR